MFYSLDYRDNVRGGRRKKTTGQVGSKIDLFYPRAFW